MCSEPTWSVGEDVHGANGVENGRLYIFLFAWFLRGLIGAVKVLMKRSRDTRLFTSFINTFWLKFSTALSLASDSNLAFHQFFFPFKYRFSFSYSSTQFRLPFPRRWTTLSFSGNEFFFRDLRGDSSDRNYLSWGSPPHRTSPPTLTRRSPFSLVMV